MKRYLTYALGCLLWMTFVAHAASIKYTYDDAGRLIGVDYGAGKHTTYTYDANGNRTAKTTATSATADLALTITPATSSVPVGVKLTNTLLIANSGPDDATGVVVTNQMPFGVVFGMASFDQGSLTIAGQSLRFDLGVIPNGDTVTVAVVMIPGLAGNYTNRAALAHNETDGTPGNNSSSVVFSATGTGDDGDFDSLPDWWEDLYGLDTNVGFGVEGGDGDKDGDGMSNMEEYIADTDPDDDRSVFTVDMIHSNESTTIFFESSAIRKYLGFAKTNMNVEGRDLIETNVMGTGLTIYMTDTNKTSVRVLGAEASVP